MGICLVSGGGGVVLFGSDGDEIQGLEHAIRVFYHQVTSPSFLRQDLTELSRLVSNFQSSCLNLTNCGDYRYAPLCPVQIFSTKKFWGSIRH